MHQDVRTTVPTPSNRLTVPRLKSVPPPVEPNEPASPRWLNYFRNESGYVGLTVVLDIWAAIMSVVVAQW